MEQHYQDIEKQNPFIDRGLEAQHNLDVPEENHDRIRALGRRTLGRVAGSLQNFNSYSKYNRKVAIALSVLGGIGTAGFIADRASGIDEAYAQDSSGNAPPVANFKWNPSFPNVNDEVTFDGSWSQDPHAPGIFQDSDYLWDFDNDNQYDDGVGRIVTHSFATVGDTWVGLQVTDEPGATDTYEQMLMVFAGPNTCYTDSQGGKVCNDSVNPNPDPKPSAAKQCIDSTIENVRIVARRRGEGRIRGKQSMRVRVEGKASAATASGEKCEKVLTTAKVWQVMERNLPNGQDSRQRRNGRLSRNSNIATVVNDNSTAFGKYARLRFRNKYTCEPGSGKRSWGLRLRVSSKSGSETETVTKKIGSRIYRGFKAC